MKYEFIVNNMHIQHVVFYRVDENIFCVTMQAHNQRSAETIFGRIEGYRMAAEGDGEFRGCFAMTHEGDILTFVGNIYNVMLLLRPRGEAVLSKDFFTQIDKHEKVSEWLNVSKQCQDQVHLLIAMVVEKAVDASNSLPVEVRGEYLSGLQSCFAKLQRNLGEDYQSPSPSPLFSH